MTKRMILMLIIFAGIFGAIFGFKWFQGKMQGEFFANFRPPPVTVSTALATQENWNPYLLSVGTLRARYGVDVSAEVGGIVKAIRFSSGAEVSQGDLLVELDDSVEQADLNSFEAQLKLAQLNYQRDKQLIEKRLASQDQFDRSQAELEDAIARVEQTRARIAKKKILAPFDGRIGILQIDPGQFIDSGTSIGSLQSLENLYLDFSLPEQNLPHLFVGQTAHFTVDAFTDTEFNAELIAIDSRVDRNTRTIQVRAQVDNRERLLIPGMFADVTLILEPAEKLIIVPVTAVTYSLYGEEVFVVNEQQNEVGNTTYVVARKNVKTGQQQGNSVAIIEGIDAGQQIVTDGQLKLRNGTEIIPAHNESAAVGMAQ